MVRSRPHEPPAPPPTRIVVPSSALRLAALLVLVPGLSGCLSFESESRRTLDPVVVIHGPAGDELGVSTDYGVAFLGRTARSGRVQFTAWFGDGPSREEGLVEPMGGGVFATESEILLPCAALCMDTLPAGTTVLVRGRHHGGVPFEFEAELAEDPAVSGVLLRPNAQLDALDDADIGAGVFHILPGKPVRLVGLLSGRVEVQGRRYFAAVGADDFWHLVVHRRNSDRPRRWVYREDIL